MTYTQEERDASVAKIVRTSVRFEYDPLGLRRSDVSFSDFQDAAAGVFCRFNGAPYYLAKLSSDRLNELILSFVEAIDEMVSTAMASSRYVGPVERLGGLANARVALSDLAGAGGNRNVTFSSIEDVPAYKRFEKGTDSWLLREASKVKVSADVVKTPLEAQSLLRQQAMDLRSMHDEVLRRVNHLRSCIAEYESLNLPATLATSIIQNSADVLQGHLDTLGAMDPVARTAKLREVTLDVLTARACVKGFGSLSADGIFAKLNGDGSPYYDENHPAQPASLLSLRSEPYSFYEGSQNVALVVDNAGSTQVNVTLQMPASYVPFVSSTARNPVALSSSVTFKVHLVGSPTPENTVNIPSGTYPLYQLAQMIDGDIGSSLESYVRLMGGINTVADAVPDADILFRVPGSDLLPLPSPAPQTWVQQGVVVGDYVLVTDRSSPGFRTMWQVTAFQAGDYEMVCTSATGSSFMGSSVSVEIGDASLQMLYISTAYSMYEPALRLMWSLQLTDTVPNDLARIGLYPLSTPSRQTKAKEVADAVNASATARDEYGVARVSATTAFSAEYTGKMRTVPSDSSRLAVYWARGDATITSIVAGPTLSVVTFSLDAVADWTSVEVGDYFIIRETEVSADIDKALTITSYDAGTREVVATIANAYAPLVDELPLLMETVKPSLMLSDNFTTLVISEATPFDGEYEVKKYDSGTPGIIQLATPIIFGVHVDYGGLPYFLAEAQWGNYRLVLTSLNSTLASYLQMRHTQLDVENPPDLIPVPNDGSSTLALTSQPQAYATTQWYSIPGVNPRVEVDDLLELYSSSSIEPDSVHTIMAGESSFNLVRVDPMVEMPQGSIPFGLSSTTPFGRVRKTRVQNYADMKALLDVWVRQPTAIPLLFFRELDAHVNTVVSAGRPTPGMVGSLVSHLQQLRTSLSGAPNSLSAALAIYNAKVVDQVTLLLKSYRDKGADRAADILEEGRFSDFFGLTMEEASYSGRLQASLKASARELPIRKTGRQASLTAAEEQMVAQYDDVDLEYAKDDLTVGDRLAIPEANDSLPAGLPQP